MELFQTIIFFCAIFHALLSDRLLKIARDKKVHGGSESIVTAFNFLGNITIIFGLWLVPILIYMWINTGAGYTYDYLQSFDFRPPFAYFALTTLGFLQPLRHLFANLLFYLTKWVNHHIAFWWSALLILSATLTGCLSEMGTMALTCTLLSTTFFTTQPSNKLSYVTLTLLLLGLGVGGTILPLNLRFSLEVFSGVSWDHWTIFSLFGWRVLIAFAALVIFAAYCFRKEFASLEGKFTQTVQKELRPFVFRELFYVVLLFIAAMNMNNPFVLFGIIALAIIFHKRDYKIAGEEGELHLKVPVFIAFFTYTLEIHASLQNWWVQPLLQQVNGVGLYASLFVLTGLNEQIPYDGLRELFSNGQADDKFFSYLAILVGSGLTVFATSANVIAKKVLGHRFPFRAISPIKHILWAMPIGAFLFALIYGMTLVGL